MSARPDLRRGGRGKCAACGHPESDAITQALLTGTLSQQKLANKYGIDRSSLQAHKAHHLSPALSVIRQSRREQQNQRSVTTAVAKVERAVADVEVVIAAAKRSKNVGQLLSALRELRPYIELLARITGELDEKPRVVVNVATSQEWITLRTTIFRVLMKYPAVLKEVAERVKQVEAA